LKGREESTKSGREQEETNHSVKTLRGKDILKTESISSTEAKHELGDER